LLVRQSDAVACENGLMGERVCRYCQRSFQPSKFQPAQAACSDPVCQRRRRNDYHRTAPNNGVRSTRTTGRNCASTILCLASITISGRRQLHFPINDNYSVAEGRREAPPGGRKGEARARSGRVGLRERDSCGGKVGNLLLVFHFSIRSRRRSCGNVGISPAVGEIPKGLVERVERLFLAFQAFHSPGISTAFRVPFWCRDSSSFMIHLRLPTAGVSRLPLSDSF
jgi:hypothetical protein